MWGYLICVKCSKRGSDKASIFIKNLLYQNINILYEDNHIIVVVKPYNVLSQGDSTGDVSIMDMIKDYIKVKYNKPGNVYLGLVHRLDRPVGGIMVFARSSKAASRLCKAFNEHRITKKYLAIVKGKVDAFGEYVDYLAKDKDGKAYVSKDGKKAVLNYELVEYNKENAFLRMSCIVP